MPRTSADPFADLLALQEDMERLFEQLGAPQQRRTAEQPAWPPAADVFRRDGDILVHLDLPGLDPKAISVSVTGNQVAVRGTRDERADVSDGDYVLRETRKGTFERRVTMPEEIDATKVHARYRSGVLEITVPRDALLQPREQQVSVFAGKAPEPEGGAPAATTPGTAAQEGDASSAQGVFAPPPGYQPPAPGGTGNVPQAPTAEGPQAAGGGGGQGDVPDAPRQAPSEDRPQKQRRSFSQWLRQEP